AKADVEPEEHESWLVLGGEEVLDERPDGEEVGEEAFERWRVESGVPRWGREIDDTILPAESGLTETHVSFTKGCYPGQEPSARNSGDRALPCGGRGRMFESCRAHPL